jgi:hypothetical protein
VAEKHIDVKWIATANQSADGLTKALTVQKHATFLEQLNMVDIKARIESQGR